MRFAFIKQKDTMDCGPSCIAMIAAYYGKHYDIELLREECALGKEGVSLRSIGKYAEKIGFHIVGGKLTPEYLTQNMILPSILFWNQNHFVVLYKIKKKQKGKVYFYIADPAKGLLTYNKDEFYEHWINTTTDNKEKGIALFLQPTPVFYEKQEEHRNRKRSFAFLFGYFRQYRRYFSQIILGLLLGSILQLIFPFLTQAIVDVGIKHRNLNFIYLILIGQLTLTISRTSVDFIRRWILLHISMRINISLVSDFFIKLLKLPMSFFDTKLMGDLLQRMNDHNRIEKFLTTQTLSVMFSLFSFIVFGIVLLCYNLTIFGIFLAFRDQHEKSEAPADTGSR